MTTRKFLSALLALFMMAGVIAVEPITTSAANTNITIAQVDTVAEIQTRIQNAIDGTSSGGGTVTVAGGKTDVDDYLILTIPNGVKVIWEANYIGNYHNMIYLYGDTATYDGTGTFEVAAGGMIKSQADNGEVIDSDHTVDIIVSGGTVETTGSNSHAISSVGGDITVSGGAVKATGTNSFAVYSYKSNITVSGGEISATVDGLIGAAVFSDEGDVTVSGGTLTIVGTEPDDESEISCIAITDGKVTINGGTVNATGDGIGAIYAFRSTVIITGGSVKAIGTDSYAIGIGAPAPYYSIAAYLAGTCEGNFNVVENAYLDGEGIIIEVDTLLVPQTRDGTNVGLITKAGTGTAVWDCSGAAPMISFSSGQSIEWGEYADAVTPVAPAISTTSLPSGSVGMAYNQILAATGDAPITWGATGLPGGLSINALTGAITGTPTAAGTFASAQITASNDAGSDTKTFSIVIAAAPVTVAPSLTGSTEMKLLQRYAATSSGTYTVTGTPVPTVTKQSGPAQITWNDTTKKLDISAGLAEGEYTVQLKASNGTAPDATMTFKLTVAKTVFSTNYESSFWNWLLFFLGFGFIWMWFV